MNQGAFYILNFHELYDSETALSPDLDPKHAISAERFEKIIELLAGYKFLDWKNQSADCQLALSFDDGHLSDVEKAAPILVKHQISALFFVLAGPLLRDDKKQRSIKKLVELGFEIGSHGMNHRIMTDLSLKEQQFEFSESKRIIEGITKVPVRYFAFPEGRFNAGLATLAKECGYERTFSTKGFKTSLKQDVCSRWTVKRDTDPTQIQKLIAGNRITLVNHSVYQGLKNSYLKLTNSF